MGFIKKNEQKNEEADTMENKKLPKKKWPGIFLLLCLLAVCAAGAYYYITVYSVTKSVLGDIEVVQSEEAVQEAEDSPPLEEEPITENEPAAGNESSIEEDMAGTADLEKDETVQIENLPEIPAVLEGTADFESENVPESEIDGEPENVFEPEKEDELEEDSELVKDNGEDETGQGEKSEDEAEDDDRAGMMADAGMEDEQDDALESEADLADGMVEMTDISIYTEEEFRDMCGRVDYKKLLRSQELYLNAAVTETLTVIEQVDGGLFDENIYYLCRREDEQGITRYYIIRDDREADAMPILEGDALRVYGQLFGSCKLPGYLVKTQPVVPALTMVYYDLLEE